MKSSKFYIDYWKDRYEKHNKLGMAMPEFTKEIAFMIIIGLVAKSYPDIPNQKSLEVNIHALKDIIPSELYAFMHSLTILNFNILEI